VPIIDCSIVSSHWVWFGFS